MRTWASARGSSRCPNTSAGVPGRIASVQVQFLEAARVPDMEGRAWGIIKGPVQEVRADGREVWAWVAVGAFTGKMCE